MARVTLTATFEQDDADELYDLVRDLGDNMAGYERPVRLGLPRGPRLVALSLDFEDYNETD